MLTLKQTNACRDALNLLQVVCNSEPLHIRQWADTSHGTPGAVVEVGRAVGTHTSYLCWMVQMHAFLRYCSRTAWTVLQK